MLTELFRQFPCFQKILYYLSEINVDTLLYFKPKYEVNTENIIRSERFHFIFSVERFMCRIDTDEPVRIGLFRIPVENRIKDVTVDLFKVVTFCYINKIIAYIRDVRIILKPFCIAELITHRKFYLLHALYLGSPVPADHDQQYNK